MTESDPTAAKVQVREQEWRIGPLTPEYLERAVELHVTVRPDEALSQLGPAVTRVTYQAYLESPRCVVRLALHDAEVVGAAVGVMGAGFLRTVLRSHPWLIGSALAWRLLRSPRFASHLAIGLQRSGAPWPGDPARRFHVLTLQVAPEWRGCGIVLPLVRAVLTEAKRRGAQEACTTVEEDNLASIFVYKALQFQASSPSAGRRHFRLDLEGADWAR